MRHIVVRAQDGSGQQVWDAELAHGADPAQVLSAAGWRPRWLGARTEGHRTVLRYEVQPAQVPVPHQRLGAYAVVPARVHGHASVLLTSFVRTRRDGWWGLPGGGLDPGEDPVVGVLREVMEETGQQVQVLQPLEVVTSHWTGGSPGSRLEDFQAVCLVYLARCPEPTEPVVHDEGGTTAEAAWVRLGGLDTLPVLDWARPLIERYAAS